MPAGCRCCYRAVCSGAAGGWAWGQCKSQSEASLPPPRAAPHLQTLVLQQGVQVLAIPQVFCPGDQAGHDVVGQHSGQRLLQGARARGQAGLGGAELVGGGLRAAAADRCRSGLLATTWGCSQAASHSLPLLPSDAGIALEGRERRRCCCAAGCLQQPLPRNSHSPPAAPRRSRSAPPARTQRRSCRVQRTSRARGGLRRLQAGAGGSDEGAGEAAARAEGSSGRGSGAPRAGQRPEQRCAEQTSLPCRMSNRPTVSAALASRVRSPRCASRSEMELPFLAAAAGGVGRGAAASALAT
jgi:hypothetical protein